MSKKIKKYQGGGQRHPLQDLWDNYWNNAGDRYFDNIYNQNANNLGISGGYNRNTPYSPEQRDYIYNYYAPQLKDQFWSERGWTGKKETKRRKRLTEKYIRDNIGQYMKPGSNFALTALRDQANNEIAKYTSSDYFQSGMQSLGSMFMQYNETIENEKEPLEMDAYETDPYQGFNTMYQSGGAVMNKKMKTPEQQATETYEGYPAWIAYSQGDIGDTEFGGVEYEPGLENMLFQNLKTRLDSTKNKIIKIADAADKNYSPDQIKRYINKHEGVQMIVNAMASKLNAPSLESMISALDEGTFKKQFNKTAQELVPELEIRREKMDSNIQNWDEFYKMSVKHHRKLQKTINKAKYLTGQTQVKATSGGLKMHQAEPITGATTSEAVIDVEPHWKEYTDDQLKEIDKKAREVWKQNNNLRFVQRAYNPNAPYMLNDEGETMTHLMSAEIDDDTGNWYVFPSIVYDTDGKLINLGPAGRDFMMSGGERIKAPDKETALWLSENYKRYVDDDRRFGDEYGQIPVSTTGYIKGSPDYDKPALKILGNNITMKGVDIPVYLVPDKGDPILAEPGSDDIYFPGASHVIEYPMAGPGAEKDRGLSKFKIKPEINTIRIDDKLNEYTTFLDEIYRTESNLNYDIMWGNLQNDLEVTPTETTLGELAEITYPQTGKYWKLAKEKQKRDIPGTPVGAFQLTGTNIRKFMKDHNLPPDVVFSPALQRAFAMSIIVDSFSGKKTKEQKIKALRNIWEGFEKSVSNEVMGNMVDEIEEAGLPTREQADYAIQQAAGLVEEDIIIPGDPKKPKKATKTPEYLEGNIPDIVVTPDMTSEQINQAIRENMAMQDYGIVTQEDLNNAVAVQAEVMARVNEQEDIAARIAATSYRLMSDDELDWLYTVGYMNDVPFSYIMGEMGQEAEDYMSGRRFDRPYRMITNQNGNTYVSAEYFNVSQKLLEYLANPTGTEENVPTILNNNGRTLKDYKAGSEYAESGESPVYIDEEGNVGVRSMEQAIALHGEFYRLSNRNVSWRDKWAQLMGAKEGDRVKNLTKEYFDTHLKIISSDELSNSEAADFMQKLEETPARELEKYLNTGELPKTFQSGSKSKQKKYSLMLIKASSWVRKQLPFVEQFRRLVDDYTTATEDEINKNAKDDSTSDYIEYNASDKYKAGGKIRIKKENKGKFTASAKRAGMGVQEYARHVLANKDKYSGTLVKRANFARNAAKWKKKQLGGMIMSNFEPLLEGTPSDSSLMENYKGMMDYFNIMQSGGFAQKYNTDDIVEIDEAEIAKMRNLGYEIEFLD